MKKLFVVLLFSYLVASSYVLTGNPVRNKDQI